MEQLQHYTAVVTDDTSALYQMRSTSGYARFVYAAYAVCGVMFYGIGIYTALGMLMYFLGGGAILTLTTSLFLCYIVLNAVIGYGFMFYRRWLLPAFSITLVFTAYPALTVSVGGILSRAAAVPSVLYLVAGILVLLLLTKRLLSGSYVALGVLIPFAGALLFSLLLTNPGMLH